MKIVFEIVGRTDEIEYDTSLVSVVPQKGDDVIILLPGEIIFYGTVILRTVDYRGSGVVNINLKKINSIP